MALPKLIKDFWYLWEIKYIWKFFRLFWKNGQICTKAVVPQRQTREILYKQNINFWRETHVLLLFKLWKQLKIYPSFARTNLHNLKMSFAKINQHGNVSAQVKTHTSASFTWLIQASLHFERLKNIGMYHDFNQMLEKTKWSVVTRMHAKPRIQTEFWFGNILKWNEREGNKRKKQTDRMFYLLFLLLLCRYWK